MKKLIALATVAVMTMVAFANAPMSLVSLTIDGAGNPCEGRTLSAIVSGGETPVRYEWTRGDAIGAWEKEAVSTSDAYTPVSKDYEHWLRIVVTMPDGSSLTNSLFFSRLPVVYITGEMPTDIEQGSRDVQLRMQGNVEHEESYVGGSQLKVRGNSTALWPKKPYKLKLAKKANPYGLGEKKNKHWVLLANYLDQSLMRNALAGEIADVFGASRMKSMWVEVVANGKQLGCYLLCEHVRVAEDRVNIFDWEKYAKDVAGSVYGPFIERWNALGISSQGELEDAFSQNLSWVNTGAMSLADGTVDISSVVPEVKNMDISGGYLYEMELIWDAVSKFWTDNKVRVNIVKPEYAVTSVPMMDTAVAILSAAEAAWSAESGYDSNVRYYTELSDLDSMVSFWLVNEIMGNDDASRGGYLYVDKGGKVTFGPVWAFDWGAGCVTVASDPIGWKCSLKPWKQCIYKDWLKHADFRVAARAAYLAHRAELGALVADDGLLDTWRVYLAESGAADTTLWLGAQNETFEKYGGARGFAADADVVKSYMATRLTWLDEQFATDDSFAASVGVNGDAEKENAKPPVENQMLAVPAAGGMNLLTTPILACVTSACAVASWKEYAEDTATYVMKVNGGGTLTIDYKVELSGSGGGGSESNSGSFSCTVDGVSTGTGEDLNASGTKSGTLEWPLSYYGEHTVVWTVSATAFGGTSIGGMGVDCSCSLYLAEPSLFQYGDWASTGNVEPIADGLKLIVTNNVSKSVALTDDLGEFILDLNGHSITGASAMAGIKIVHGNGTGTHLKIVDSQQTGTATVSGGGWNWSAYVGGPGVEVAADAVDVLISVGPGVTVVGGDTASEWVGGVYEGASGIVGNVKRNDGIIRGAAGSHGYSDYYGSGGEEMGYPGGTGGCGVKGNIEENYGTILAGCGGDAASSTAWETWGDYDGGPGGIGVYGDVGFNYGTITGGKGGDSEIGTGGAGGIGVYGDISYNESSGMVYGGRGGGCQHDVWIAGGSGGLALDGYVMEDYGTITDGIAGGASATASASYTYDGNGRDLVVRIYNIPDWYTISSVTVGGAAATPVATGGGTYTATLASAYINAGSYSPAVRIVATNSNNSHEDVKEFNGSVTISKKSIYGVSVSSIPSVTYSGNFFQPTPTVTDTARGVTLVNGTDYSLSYSNNKNAGTAYVTITGKGNYSGSTNRSFTIAKHTVTSPITVYLGSQLTYNGTAQSLNISFVRDDSGMIISSYTQSGNTATDAGTHTLTITGSGNFTGSATWEYTIDHKSIEGSIVTLGDALTYTGSPQSQGVASVVIDSLSATFDVSNDTATDAGEHTLTVTGTGNFTGSTTKQFMIAPKPLAAAMVGAVANVTYTGSAFTPEPTVTDAARSVTLAKGTDYTLSYMNNTAAGTATVTVNGMGNYTGSIQQNFIITKQIVVPPVIPFKQYTGTPQTADVPASSLYMVIQNIPQTQPGTYSIMLQLKDSQNYAWQGSESSLYTIPFTIISAEETTLEAIFNGLPATVEDDGAGGWKVTITSDITGPVTLPDNLGHVTIDLNGHDIVGAEGEPAIRISASGDESGATTRLSLVTTGGDALVQGGAGAPAILVEASARAGVVIDIGAGVTVQGGEDAPAVSGGTIGTNEGMLVKVKVAVPVISPIAWTGEPVSPVIPESPDYTAAPSSGTAPGAYPVILTLSDAVNYEWQPRDGATIIGAMATTTFTILEPPPKIVIDDGGHSGAANSASYVGVYDGAAHGIDVKVTNPATGWAVKYALSAAGPFTLEKPMFTDVVDAVETWYEVTAEGFDPVTNSAAVTITPRSIASAELGSIHFEETGGVRTPVPTLVDDLGHAIAPANYAFEWSEEPSGAMTLTFTGCGNYLGFLEKHLAQTHFHVSFDAGGGVVDVECGDYDIGTYYGSLPTPFRAGYVFDGWYESADFSGEPVTRNTEVIASDLTLHAKWLRRALWYSDAVFHTEAAAVWEGYILGAGDVVVGSISVKAAKPDRSTGLVKLTVTVEIAGEKKATLKASTYDGHVEGTVGGRQLSMTLGESSLTGTLGGYALDGARNVFSSKNADSTLKAAQALKRWQGTYVVAWDGGNGWNGLSIEVKAKGKAKVSGTLADGTKVSASSQLLVGERECALAVSWTKKAASVACLVWFREDGTVECGNLSGGAVAVIANSRTGAYLISGSKFRLNVAAVAAAIPGAQMALLPDGLAVRMNGAKFDIDKAGKVKLLKDKSGIDPSLLGTNPSGLKLTYTIKNCTFKGSFQVYTLVGGKLKKVSVQVSGVVLGGKGYGTASVKKPYVSWPVSIE